MPREMHLNAFRQQAFATALTTPGKGGASTFGAHPGTETMLLFSGPFRSLQGAFHGRK
jgi:hypothetical protein